MNIRRIIKLYFEKITGLKIFNILPIGIDPVYDVHRVLKNHNFDIIFDVGANIGQSTNRFKKAFPDSLIYCFEPAVAAFKNLELITKKNRNIKCLRLALSNKNEKLTFFIDKNNPTSTMNSTRKDENIEKHKDYEAQEVEALTLDYFCKKNKLDHISYLKIDTEGNDLKVLIGADEMLTNYLIDVVQVEVGMNPTNTFHVPYSEVKQYLEDRNYYLFGLYDQNHEWIEKKPILRRCDALFVSKNIYSKIQ